jgi:cell division protein ZipA
LSSLSANKQETILESQSQDEVEALLATPEKAEDEKAETELSLNPNIATVEIEEFDGESNILDVHLHEQQRCDDESALATAEQIIALMFIQTHAVLCLVIKLSKYC